MFGILMGNVPAPLQGFVNGLQSLLARLGVVGKWLWWMAAHWWQSYIVLVVVLTFLLNYLPDVATTRTYEKVLITETSLNSGVYGIDLQYDFIDSTTGFPAAEQVRNERQISDLHFSASNLQAKAKSYANHNKQVLNGQSKEPLATVTVRISGFAVGNANRAGNLTQINPGMWGPLYNLFGWATNVVLWLLPLGAIMLVLWRRNRVTLSLAGLMVLGFVVDWIFL